MARSVSHTMTRITHHPSMTRLAILRTHTTQPRPASKPKTKEEVERAALKKLEEVIHRMIVKKSQPDWLPLVPGGSYWVPPKSKSRGFAQVVAKLVKDSTSVRNVVRGPPFSGSNPSWPCSPRFFKGESHSPLEGEMTSKQSEEEEV